MAEERSQPFSLKPGEPPRKRRKLPGWIWLAGGALAGVAITLVVQGAILAEERSASDRMPVGKAPKSPVIKQAPEKSVAPSPPSQGPPPPQALTNKPPQEKQPVSQQPPAEIHGSLPSVPVRPVNPIVIERPAEKPAPKPQSRLTEVSVRVHQTEGDETQAQIEGIAKSAGGTAKRFTIPKTTREREREVFILIVSEAKVDDVAAALLTIGLANLRDEWKGPASDLPARIDRPFRDALADLSREERDLEEKYLDDAPQLKDVRERIDSLRNQIDSLPQPPAGTAAVRVFLGYRV
jgi:hypothetical protein